MQKSDIGLVGLAVMGENLVMNMESKGFSGALTTTVLEDYATPADEEMVWSIYQGNARVKR